MMKKDLRTERERHRKEENKKFILKTAEKIFTQKGYSLSTMDEIAENTQFSKATLYHYFKSKGELFFEIIYNTFEEALQKIKKVQAMDASAEEKLREVIYNVGYYYHTKKNIARIFIMEKSLMRKLLRTDLTAPSTPSSHPPIPGRLRTILEEMFGVMSSIIEVGVASGEFRKMDSRQACFILSAMIRGFHFKGPVSGGELSLRESTDLLHNFFLYGIKKDRTT